MIFKGLEIFTLNIKTRVANSGCTKWANYGILLPFSACFALRGSCLCRQLIVKSLLTMGACLVTDKNVYLALALQHHDKD